MRPASCICGLILSSRPAFFFGERPGSRKPKRSGLLDGVFCEDLLGPLERVVDRLLRAHSVVYNLELGDAKQVLAINLGDRRVVSFVNRHQLTEQGQLSIRLAMWVLLEPERVVLGDL